ncbi:glycosyltransferase family 2 protein [Erythrobacteraceae bacterium WH01K]|nr:glycosyltransferase family 2 protein [Erythrobacteraceae bacterium WH01K]
MPQLAVILPTLNERENLASLVERIETALAGIAWEIVIVDDDSADGTADLARRLAAADARIRVLHRIGRRGLASAVLEGVLATPARFVAVMDADHQHDPALLERMLDSVANGHADIAVASRFMEGASAAGLDGAGRAKASGLGNRLARAVTGVRLSDPMSGYFLMRTDALRALAPRLSGIGFKLLLDILSAAPGQLRVVEVPLRFAERRSGTSKLDNAVAFEFLVGLYDRYLGRIVPTRFAMFASVGALGVAVHVAVLALLHVALSSEFVFAQALATLAAMTFNFWLNNLLTYADRRLRGAGALLRGWAGFCLTCSVGALANVGLAGFLEARGLYWLLAAGAGIVIGAVWNYALSSRFVWGRF